MKLSLIFIGAAAILSSSCARQDVRHEKESAAFKAGEAAHAVAKESEKALKSARKEVVKEAKEVRKGWDEARRDDKDKK